MKDTNAILTIAYPEVEKAIKSNLNNYKKYISQFINSRSELLYSNTPSQQIYFTSTDVESFFKATQISKSKISNAIQNTYYASIGNFNPSYAKDDCTIALLCLVRYFKSKHMQKELELALINMGFSGKFYPSIWHRSFQVFPPQENIMEYVITHMTTNKYDIVREGSVIGAVRSICTTWVNAYDDKFKEFNDDDCAYLVQQLHNRIGSFMNNIAELYYKAYKDKEYITYDSDDVSEDNYRLADSDSFKLERVVSTTMAYINNHGVDQRICKMASDSLVKTDELKSIIEVALSNNDNIPLIREFITLLVACYFQQPNNNKDVRDLSFVAYCVKAKPNSKDPYIIRQRELLIIILTNNSEHFNRRKNRKETAQAYYRDLTLYFALIIQEAMK